MSDFDGFISIWYPFWSAFEWFLNHKNPISIDKSRHHYCGFVETWPTCVNPRCNLRKKKEYQRNRSIKIHGKVKNLKPLLSKTFCGIANLNVSSGIQTKLLTYMSYGIPSISSQQVINNFDAIKSSLPFYKNEKELIKHLSF